MKLTKRMTCFEVECSVAIHAVTSSAGTLARAVVVSAHARYILKIRAVRVPDGQPVSAQHRRWILTDVGRKMTGNEFPAGLCGGQTQVLEPSERVTRRGRAWVP